MLVTDKESLKKMLRNNEKNIEVVGDYADIVMRKFNSYLFSKNNWTLSLAAVYIHPWYEKLLMYTVENYCKNRLTLKRKTLL